MRAVGGLTVGGGGVERHETEANLACTNHEASNTLG